MVVVNFPRCRVAVLAMLLCGVSCFTEILPAALEPEPACILHKAFKVVADQSYDNSKCSIRFYEHDSGQLLLEQEFTGQAVTINLPMQTLDMTIVNSAGAQIFSTPIDDVCLIGATDTIIIYGGAVFDVCFSHGYTDHFLKRYFRYVKRRDIARLRDILPQVKRMGLINEPGENGMLALSHVINYLRGLVATLEADIFVVHQKNPRLTVDEIQRSVCELGGGSKHSRTIYDRGNNAFSVIKTLVRYGASWHIQDSSGRRPLDYIGSFKNDFLFALKLPCPCPVCLSEEKLCEMLSCCHLLCQECKNAILQRPEDQRLCPECRKPIA